MKFWYSKSKPATSASSPPPLGASPSHQTVVLKHETPHHFLEVRSYPANGQPSSAVPSYSSPRSRSRPSRPYAGNPPWPAHYQTRFHLPEHLYSYKDDMLNPPRYSTQPTNNNATTQLQQPPSGILTPASGYETPLPPYRSHASRRPSVHQVLGPSSSLHAHRVTHEDILEALRLEVLELRTQLDRANARIRLFEDRMYNDRNDLWAAVADLADGVNDLHTAVRK